MKAIQILGNSTFGGATTLVLDWCKYLSDNGYSVHVLTTDPRSIFEFKKIKEVIIRQDILIPRNIAPYQDLKALFALYTILRREKFQVVHTYSATPSFIGRLAAYLARVPVVLHHQAGWTRNEAKSLFSKFLYEILEGIAIRLSTKSICVSKAIRIQANNYKLIPKSKLITICNGIDVNKFFAIDKNNNRERLLKELNLKPESILLGFIGRLAEQKDLFTLIKAFSVVKSFYSKDQIKLILVGDGPDKVSLEILVGSFGLEKDVIFLGFRKDIPEILASLNVFINPSLWEGLSVSILEAMTSGCPIIVTDILPNAELIENEVTGLLVPIRSPHKLAEAIMNLINNPEKAKFLGSSAKERVVSSYTMDRMFTQTLDLYKELLDKNSE